MTMAYRFPVLKDELKGKRVLVTGGTKGMGEAMVRRFRLGGASVATTARSPLHADQKPALFVQADLGTQEGVREVAGRILQEWGGVDILVNNVGGSEAPNGGFQALSDEDWQRALEVNLLAAVRLDRAFVPGMIERQSSFTSLPSSIVCRFMTRPSRTLRQREPCAPTAKVLPTKSVPEGSGSTWFLQGLSRRQAHTA